jgi:hypothetical protein
VQLVAKRGAQRPPPTPTAPRNNGESCGSSADDYPSNPSPPRGEGGCLLFEPISNMSVDDVGSKRNNAFVYHGREGENIPNGVICVRVHPSVRVIRARAFLRRKLLMSVELHNGIEVIKEEAFRRCTSLREILIPPSVRAIKGSAFGDCAGLTTAFLNDGLEEIGAFAFARCRSLVRIATPPCRQGNQALRILSLLGVDNCDSQQWAGGDWGVCILWMHVPRTHRNPPLHQGDQGFGIQWLHGVDHCDSQQWAGGDWGGGI